MARAGKLTLFIVLTASLLASFAHVANAGQVSPSTPGLLRLLYLDGNANDATGTENGVIQGDPAFPVTGCISGACFEGNGNDAVTLPTLFDVVPAAWSIEVWVRLDQFPSGCAVFTGKRNGGDFIEHYIAYTSICTGDEIGQRFRFFSWAGVEHDDILIVAPDLVVLGAWYLLTFTFDGTTYRAYVNGQEVGSQAGPAIPNGTAHDFRIGGRDAGPIDMFVTGRIDEFAAYDRALSSAEVLTHYQAGAGGRQLTALSPANVWMGLKNSDAVGLRVDVLAEVFVNGDKVGEGQLANAPTGSSGFNNARLQSIPLALTGGPVSVPADAELSVQVSVRRTCFGAGHNSGQVRLWYNGQAVDSGAGRDAGSRFDATIGGDTADYFLRGGSMLATQAGTARLFIDRAVNSAVACPGRPFTPFGAWSLELP